MKLTVEILNKTTGHTKYAARKALFAKVMNKHGGDTLAPHRMALLLSQVGHESGGFRYIKEVWGPTKAQRGYEGRRDLGNVKSGDGKRFMGRDLMQITGRDNYRELTKWVEPRGGFPDFEARPEELEKHLGIGVLWYWTMRVPAKYIEAGNTEMVTRRVNGGLNGYADRLKYYDRAALAYLSMDSIMEFQKRAGIVPDGVSGPVTRRKLHDALHDMKDAKPSQTGLISAIVAIFKAIFERKSK